MIVVPELEPAAIRAAHERIDPAFTRTAPVRPRGPVARASACRSSSRSRRSTRSARSRAAGPGSSSTPWRGRGRSARTGRSSACRPATSARASPTPPGRSACRPSCSARPTRTRARSSGCAPSARRSSRTGEDFDDARGASEAYADGARRGAARRRRRPADLDRRGHDGAGGDRRRRGRPAAGAGRRGRARSATARSSTASGSWLRHAAPGCRVVGIQAEEAPAMTLSWRAGRPIDTPRRRPTPTASPRGSPSRARSS